MAKRKESRREYLMIEGIDPETGKLTAQIQISYDRLHKISTRSIGQLKEAAEIVPQVLQKPTAIFEGLCLDNDEDHRGCGWRCYVGLPDRAYRADGEQLPPLDGMIYMVFINSEGIAYNWRWENADETNPELPMDYGLRFIKRLI